MKIEIGKTYRCLVGRVSIFTDVRDYGFNAKTHKGTFPFLGIIHSVGMSFYNSDGKEWRDITMYEIYREDV